MSYGLKDILVLPQNLQDFAWSAPMRDLAANIGLSDVGLKKLLKSHGVVTPPQGHWNRAHAGKPVPKCPKLPARRPGETGRVHVDHRFANFLTAVEPMPSSGPFASAAVPEDLDELYQQELKAIGRVAVPRKLERFHHGLAQIFKQEERRRGKFAASNWSWDAPKFDSPLDQRRFRIINAIFMALSRRSHGGRASERDGRIDVMATIGDTGVGLDITIAGKHRTVREYGRDVPARDLPPSTPLALVIDAGRDRLGTSFQDDASGKLESKIAEIVARIIVAGEAAFRRHLKEREELEEQFRRWEEKRRREEIERRNAKRLKASSRERRPAPPGRGSARPDRPRAQCGGCRFSGGRSSAARRVGAVGVGRGGQARPDRIRSDHGALGAARGQVRRTELGFT
jgi:hypothetical protein